MGMMMASGRRLPIRITTYAPMPQRLIHSS